MRLPVSRKTSRAPHLTAFALTAALSLLNSPSHASGQERRADLIAAEQAQKAQRRPPLNPPGPSASLTRISDTFLQPRDGLYPYLGSVYGGGGFTPGAGFLRYWVHAWFKRTDEGWRWVGFRRLP